MSCVPLQKDVFILEMLDWRKCWQKDCFWVTYSLKPGMSGQAWVCKYHLIHWWITKPSCLFITRMKRSAQRQPKRQEKYQRENPTVWYFVLLCDSTRGLIGVKRGKQQWNRYDWESSEHYLWRSPGLACENVCHKSLV